MNRRNTHCLAAETVTYPHFQQYFPHLQLSTRYRNSLLTRQPQTAEKLLHIVDVFGCAWYFLGHGARHCSAISTGQTRIMGDVRGLVWHRVPAAGFAEAGWTGHSFPARFNPPSRVSLDSSADVPTTDSPQEATPRTAPRGLATPRFGSFGGTLVPRCRAYLLRSSFLRLAAPNRFALRKRLQTRCATHSISAYSRASHFGGRRIEGSLDSPEVCDPNCPGAVRIFCWRDTPAFPRHSLVFLFTLDPARAGESPS